MTRVSGVNSPAEQPRPRRERRTRSRSRARCKPALDRAHGQGQGPGGELLTLALQVAENNQDAEGFGEAVDFVVQHRAGWVVAGTIVGGSPGQGGLSLALTAAAGDGLGAGGRSPGDTMEPGPERVMDPELVRLAEQHQESRLECVLGVVADRGGGLCRRGGPSVRGVRPAR